MWIRLSLIFIIMFLQKSDKQKQNRKVFEKHLEVKIRGDLKEKIPKATSGCVYYSLVMFKLLSKVEFRNILIYLKMHS